MFGFKVAIELKINLVINTMERQGKMRNYLKNRINPIFERMIVDILIDTPDNLVNFYCFLKK